MKYAWLVIAIFAARFFATAIAFPSGDGDLAWQRWLGKLITREHAIPHALGSETFTAGGAPWLAQEWLFSLVAGAARAGLGWDAFAAAVALCAVVALALAAYRAERLGASPRAVAVCTALAGLGLFQSFGVRAQVVAWPLLALYVLLLDLEGPWAYAALGVAAVWSNLHASAVLAPLLAAIVAAARAGQARDLRDAGARRAALVALGSLAAICCNPFGWHLPQYAVGLFGNPIKTYISEWKVTDLGDTSFAFGALPLLLIAMLVRAGPGRTRLPNLCLLAVFAFLLLGAARNIALFALVASPIVAAALARFEWFGLARREPARDAERGRRSGLALLAGALVAALFVGVQLVRHAPPESDLPSAPLRALAAVAGPHRLFCADFSWCGLAVGVPNVRVFLDGRADPYPPAVWRDFATIARLGGRWRATLDRRRVDAVLVSRDAPLDQALAETAGWHARYSDKGYRLWLRAPRRAAGA